ncbi:DNA (cytosine-5-)-methyltransferase [Avibacterium gallinarum]|uniref:Cytosine-specific methyltransferase n=1 Tax=Avibacterium gallinarum TaxID=755 RepID=A0A379AYF6_AVIGA|nr:DNA (cytosine-5-)-methyltransferase [Avibacterium gallinarum]POY44713.1 DNA (cytosine-5-)-methyltransferase [Avibacterium gallinarum]TDP30510.1 DNA (cytosine-5)-methyltransferase 1 [Avibacterium gallinarum]SUB27010.1 Modification methylase HhaI [Avibacterium gallinarum]
MHKIRTFLDLCSGIGGGRLGLELAGLKSIGYSDTSKLAVRTYKLMHDTTNEPYYYNLKRINTEKLPLYDLLIAGFPCQTFSVIGRKEGFSDNRGQIIFHIVRILENTQPKCFLLENVKGLVTHDKGNTIKIIIDELNRVGYDVVYKVLTSLEYGVPQMRQRVYFIGVRKDLGKDISDFKWPEPIEKPPLSNFLIDNNIATSERLEILSYYLKNPVNNGRYTVNDIKNMEGKIIDTRMNDLRIYCDRCPTLRAQRDGVLYVKEHTIYQLTGYEALLLQGFPKEYADKVKNEVSDRHLLMQAGNAMTVNVIHMLGNSIRSFFQDTTED